MYRPVLQTSSVHPKKQFLNSNVIQPSILQKSGQIQFFSKSNYRNFPFLRVWGDIIINKGYIFIYFYIIIFKIYICISAGVLGSVKQLKNHLYVQKLYICTFVKYWMDLYIFLSLFLDYSNVSCTCMNCIICNIQLQHD